MKKFCPKCGKTITKNVFCEECQPLKVNFKPINIKLCPSKKYFFKGKWTSFEDLKKVTKDILSKNIKENFKIKQGLEQYSEILEMNGITKKLDIMIEIKEHELIIPITVEVTICPQLSKVGSTYFEGILQVRNVSEDVKNFIKEYLSKEQIFVNKIIEKKNYIDYYFVKKKYLTSVSEKIISEFGGSIDLNAQLFSKNQLTSKDIYRVNAIVYVPFFRKKDIILLNDKKNDKLILIKGVGKIITGINLEDENKIQFKYDHEKKYEIIQKKKTKIITLNPVKVLNSEYELIEILNPLHLKIENEQIINIIEYAGKAYIVN